MGDKLKEIDPSKEKLSKFTKHYMQAVERLNLERAKRLEVVRHKNRIGAFVLATTVGCIYTYTLLATKQETFLDDFEEPVMISDETPQKK